MPYRRVSLLLFLPDKLLPGLGPGTSSLPMRCATTCAKAADS